MASLTSLGVTVELISSVHNDKTGSNVLGEHKRSWTERILPFALDKVEGSYWTCM